MGNMDQDLQINSVVSIALHDGSVVYYKQVVRARLKYMRMTLETSGGIVVSTPHRKRESDIAAFITKHSGWLLKSQRKLALYNEKIKHSLPLRYTADDFKSRKAEAMARVLERVNIYCKEYSRAPSEVRIKLMRSRWGSCSKKGTLHFSFALLFVPQRLIDYVVVHELCHLLEFNHSPKFWQLVSDTLPDYRALRKELRRYRHQP